MTTLKPIRVALSLDSKIFVTGSKKGTTCLWDTETGAFIREFERESKKFFRETIETLALSSDAKRVFAGSEHGTAYLRKIKI